MLRKFLVTVFLALTPIAASATPQFTNNTGLWWRSDESGWGLYLAHQGDTLFGTLFVYGPDNKPKWFSASSLVGDDGGPNHDRPRVFTGALYESTGSPFNVPFDPGTVTRRQVGTMTVEVMGFGATLTYNVDDLRVTKSITPLSFRRNEVSGNYAGVAYRPATSSAGPFVDDTNISLNVSGSSFTMTTQGAVSGTCTYSGTATPSMGNEVYFSGNYMCPNGRSDAIGFYIDPTPDGFATQFGGLIGFGGSTLLSAVRTGPATFVGNGWMNDLWLAPGESGWGLNLIGEGDTVFGTLFVYGTDRQPKWYSASALTFTPGGSSDSRGRYSGALYESTGPWYGLVSFNQNQVTRREVGTISVDLSDKRASMTYTIDGATVTKQLEPFTMRANVLSGSYVGKRIDLSTGTSETLNIAVTDGGGFAMTTLAMGIQCTYQAPASGRGQAGQRVFVAGSYSCGNGRSGTFTLADTEVFFAGFTGSFSVDGRAGHIAASRGSF